MFYGMILTNIVLIGDSHIDQWIYGIHTYLLHKSIYIYFLLVNGLRDIASYRMNRIISQVKIIKSVKMIVLCNFKYNIEFKDSFDFIRNYDRYYVEMQRLLLNYSNNIAVLNDNPHLLTPSYECLNNKKRSPYLIYHYLITKI